MKNFTLMIMVCLLGFVADAQDLTISLVADGFSSPTDIEHAGDDRLFILERRGTIKIIQSDGSVSADLFLDIRDRVRSGGERGLLGIAFHPAFPDTPYFYVNYTNLASNTTVSRFTITADSNRADLDSELVLLNVEQPFSNHNGGDIAFGPDGYLYTALGDGGSANDPGNRSQNPLTMLGKMLRIDVDTGNPYSIPPDNPFAEDDFTLDEIWALGLRNPWRFSFDSETGDLYIADVGQNVWEEIDFQSSSSMGGENYGWRCFEGNDPFNQNPPCPDGLVGPIHVYEHSGANGCSVTGGFVYRGTVISQLFGQYVYGDFCSGRCWTLMMDMNGDWVNSYLFNVRPNELSTFGEGVDGEIYLAYLGRGEVYKLIDDCIENPLAAPEITFEDSTLSIIGNFPTIRWWLDGAIIATQVTSIQTEADGIYWATVEDNRECGAITDSVDVRLTSNNDISLAGFEIYPNPFKDVLHITMPDKFNTGQALVMDVHGKIMHTLDVSNPSNREIDASKWPVGIYFVVFDSPARQSVVKAVKIP